MYVASGAPTDSYTMTSSHEETYESYRKEYPKIRHKSTNLSWFQVLRIKLQKWFAIFSLLSLGD